ncbi:hypothetical protein L6452_27492 [Arctium lappa]|uniref:Uncharacterized protein n=1 Tax=Arctium lappa TaxID=4217 RepID=A0ACB9A0P7_ARCLA|nr:hypothetical protein L6452_27492 [Arctium lappa]
MEHEFSEKSSYRPEFDSSGHDSRQQVGVGEGHEFGPEVDTSSCPEFNPFLDNPNIDDEQRDGLVEDDSEEECEQDDGEDVDYMVDQTHEMEEQRPPSKNPLLPFQTHKALESEIPVTTPHHRLLHIYQPSHRIPPLRSLPHRPWLELVNCSRISKAESVIDVVTPEELRLLSHQLPHRRRRRRRFVSPEKPFMSDNTPWSLGGVALRTGNLRCVGS